MANKDRKIIRGVRVGGKTYVSGMEDELDALLSTADVGRLRSKGYLEGKWAGGSPEPEPEDKSKPAKKEK